LILLELRPLNGGAGWERKKTTSSVDAVVRLIEKNYALLTDSTSRTKANGGYSVKPQDLWSAGQ